MSAEKYAQQIDESLDRYERMMEAAKGSEQAVNLGRELFKAELVTKLCSAANAERLEQISPPEIWDVMRWRAKGTEL